MRKIRRRGIRLMNRSETFRTYDLVTGEYTGTWRRWGETLPARRRTAEKGGRDAVHQ
jgi:hypothetical protein